MTIRAATQIAVWDDFDRANGAPSTTPWGLTYKQAAANFVITSNALVKLTGTSTNRYFALLPGPSQTIRIKAFIRTSPTTNTTDLGFAFRSLDSTASRGGQAYVSLRKTGSGNSIRFLYRGDTSGTDTLVGTANNAAGWADDTDYEIDIIVNGAALEILVNGVSKHTATLTAPQLAALTGTDVGISFTNTDAGSKVYYFDVQDLALPASPVATTTKVVGHRSTPWTAADTTEEQPTGLALLPTAVAGPEADARHTTNGDYGLCHDPTFDRTSPTGATGSCTNASTAAWVAAGMCFVGDFLDACQPYEYGDIHIQFEMSQQSHITGLVAILNAHTMRDRIIAMTSAADGATPNFAELRTAGWTGRIGCYGLTVANWAAGINASFQTYKLVASGADMIGYLFRGDDQYDANVALISTLHAAGHLVGASTITPNRFADAVARGVDYVLTDQPAEFLAAYTPPANEPLPVARVGRSRTRPSVFRLPTIF